MGRRAYSPRDVERLHIKELPLEGRWEDAFGRPSMTETWFVTGQSASGKSSFVMQLSKQLCAFGNVLYMSLEEGISKSFKERMERCGMYDEQGRFRVIKDEDLEALKERLGKPKSASFIVVDSFQYTGWDYQDARTLVDMFPHKSFVFVSQEDKGRPLGKAAVRLKYMAGVKVRTVGFRAICQGRFVESAEAWFDIWPEGSVKVWNQ